MAYEFEHHGIRGQKWGVQNGPPYPLGAGDHNASERKAGWRKSLKNPKVLSDAKKDARGIQRDINSASKSLRRQEYELKEASKKMVSEISSRSKKIQKLSDNENNSPKAAERRAIERAKIEAAYAKYKAQVEKRNAIKSDLNELINAAKAKGFDLSISDKNQTVINGKAIWKSMMRDSVANIPLSLIGLKRVTIKPEFILKANKYLVSPNSNLTKEEKAKFDKYANVANSSKVAAWRLYSSNKKSDSDRNRKFLVTKYADAEEKFNEIEDKHVNGKDYSGRDYVAALTNLYAAEVALYEYDKKKGYYKD